MISQFEQPIDYLRNCGYTPQASMLLLAEYYKKRAQGISPDEASCIFFDYIASAMNGTEDIMEEVKAFHKRLCRKGYKPEQVADAVEEYYNKEE